MAKKIIVSLIVIFVLLGLIGIYIDFLGERESMDKKPSANLDGMWPMDITLGGDYGALTKWMSSGLIIPDGADLADTEVLSGVISDNLEHLKGSPHALAMTYNTLLEHDGWIKAEDLYQEIDGQYWSNDKAKEVYQELVAFLASRRVEYTTAPPKDYFNTGLSAQGDVVRSSKPGVSGDTRAFMFQHPTDSSRDFAWLARCANWCIQKPKGKIPVGKTDEDELTPKSNNIKDYGAIEGAPKAPTTKLTPPPKEHNSAPGESQITDKPTTPAPNLTAPGATGADQASKSVPDALGSKSQAYVPNHNDTNSPGNATTTVTHTGGSNDNNVTNNVGDTSVPVGTPGGLPDAVSPGSLDGNAENDVVNGAVPID